MITLCIKRVSSIDPLDLSLDKAILARTPADESGIRVVPPEHTLRRSPDEMAGAKEILVMSIARMIR
jgi:hypothetical protein